MGQGLYMVKAVVAAHEGSVEIASEPGKGTIVTVNLPLVSR
jgi:signal transduction histidine kinase